MQISHRADQNLHRTRSFVRGRLFCLLLSVITISSLTPAQQVTAADPDNAPGTELLAEYFRQQTQQLSDRCLADVKTAEDWTAQRAARHLELREMLGLSPWPERTPLNTVITGTLEQDDFIVEKLHFQSRPGLYVIGNLYRPKVVTERLPAILYQCGHAKVVDGTVSLGNKAAYQHHGAWFAKNGYVCLIIDTIQLGEISGIHHGTHHLGMWSWLDRGYTPTGVETWNAMRAIDYLQSRPEVDPERIGATGRSGGGACTWYVAAIDERVKAAAPTAGITNMHNQIVDGCVAGHCDCMFFVNRYGWDFPLLASMIAPRPLLIINTDRDPIFPLDGVVDVHARTRQLYKLVGADDKTGLFLCMGGHIDYQHVQNAAFQWFNHYLKQQDGPITMAAVKPFKPAQLRVFEQLPADERVTSVQDWFIPQRTFDPSATPSDGSTYQPSRVGLLSGDKLDVKLISTQTQNGKRWRRFEYASEAPYRLEFDVLDDGTDSENKIVTIHILEPAAWDEQTSRLSSFFKSGSSSADLPTLPANEIQVYVAPRGAGATRWSSDVKTVTHIRRRFSLLGTTEDERRTIDVANALQAIPLALGKTAEPLKITAQELAAGWSLHASLLLKTPYDFQLKDLPTTSTDGPHFLAIEQKTTLPELVLQAAKTGHQFQLTSSTAESKAYWQSVQVWAAKRGVTTIGIAQ